MVFHMEGILRKNSEAQECSAEHLYDSQFSRDLEAFCHSHPFDAWRLSPPIASELSLLLNAEAVSGTTNDAVDNALWDCSKKTFPAAAPPCLQFSVMRPEHVNICKKHVF